MSFDDYENFYYRILTFMIFLYIHSGFKIYTIPIFIFWCCNDCIGVKH